MVYDSYNTNRTKPLFQYRQNFQAVRCFSSIGDIENFTAKSTGRELKKRDIQLRDETHTMILTIWNEKAEEAYDDSDSILLIKNAKTGDFNGK